MPKLPKLKPNSQQLTAKRSAELKSLVHNFDFWEPDWSKFPENPLSIQTNELTKYESGLLTAIKLAYLNSNQGRKNIRKRFVKAGGFVFAILGLVAFAHLTITSPAVSVVKSVAAATVSAILR